MEILNSDAAVPLMTHIVADSHIYLWHRGLELRLPLRQVAFLSVLRLMSLFISQRLGTHFTPLLNKILKPSFKNAPDKKGGISKTF